MVVQRRSDYSVKLWLELDWAATLKPEMFCWLDCGMNIPHYIKQYAKGKWNISGLCYYQNQFCSGITAGVCYWPLKVKGTIKLPPTNGRSVVFQNCVKVAVAKAGKVIFCFQQNKWKRKRMFQTHTRKKFLSFLKDPSFASSYIFSNFQKAKLIHLSKESNYKNVTAVCCSRILKIAPGIKMRTTILLYSLYFAENLCGMWVGLLLIAFSKYSLLWLTFLNLVLQCSIYLLQ